VRFCYEWHDTQGQWYRSHGNENWEFDANGYMQASAATTTTHPSIYPAIPSPRAR
jgi:hypothetical protein